MKELHLVDDHRSSTGYSTIVFEISADWPSDVRRTCCREPCFPTKNRVPGQRTGRFRNRARRGAKVQECAVPSGEHVMRVPTIHGTIRRRILVNFRVDAEVMQRQ